MLGKSFGLLFGNIIYLFIAILPNTISHYLFDSYHDQPFDIVARIRRRALQIQFSVSFCFSFTLPKCYSMVK